MAQKSRLLKILRAAEDVLLFFDDYFKSTSWVYHGTDLSGYQIRKSKNYLINKKRLDKSLVLKKASKDSPQRVLALITKPWDKKWRLVTFDIPEKERDKRDKLRYQLEELGLKHFQRSVWISPLPVNQHLKKIVRQIDNREELSIFIGRLFSQAQKQLVGDLWEIDWWQKKAEELISKFKKEEKIKAADKKQFWDLVLVHPKVPLDLLPSDWPLEQLIKTFKVKIKD